MQKISLLISLLALSMLTGCLPVIFAGAGTSVYSFAKDRKASETLTDHKVAASIKARFMKSDFKDLYTKIKVEVVQGRVLYTGTIDKEEDAIMAVKTAWDHKEVVEVINELKVDDKSNNFDLFQYTRDTLITSQIKSKIFVNRSVKFSNYTVITLNDEVYLFGIARSQEELELVAKISANIHGVKKVTSHVKIKEALQKDTDKSNITNVTNSNQNSLDNEW